MKLISQRPGYNTYEWNCPCGAKGEVEVESQQRAPFGCPENCGHVYLQWYHGKKPVLQCVVAPIVSDIGNIKKFAPAECSKCGSPTGPVLEIDAECPGWLCPSCYKLLES